ncbi:MAG TPA: hypothetical protein VFL73_05380 [Solirubrobacteraceae bacterium]|nr:hypothetical protein [Solirubrobacteraceae bacterium]
MKVAADRFDPNARAREKQNSRVADERALVADPRSAAWIRRENEAFAALAGSARVNLAASKSLA